MASTQPSPKSGEQRFTPAPMILYVTGNNDGSAFHVAHLRNAGYRVEILRAWRELLDDSVQMKAEAVVVGHGLEFADRIEVEQAVRRWQPRPRIVLLYDTSISQTEQADAVLSVTSEPQHLAQTIQYLLTGKD